MIGRLCVVRDAVMVTMNTTGARYFSNEVRCEVCIVPGRKELNWQIVISFGCEHKVRLSFQSSLVTAGPSRRLRGYAKQWHAPLLH